MGWTREEYNAYHLARYHRIRSEYFADKTCCQCGTSERLRLRYNGDDNLNLSNLWSWKKTRREEVLRQCRVMCRGCWARSWVTVDWRQRRVDELLHAVWMRNWRRYRWILRRQGVRTPIAAPTEEYVKMVLETIATL